MIAPVQTAEQAHTTSKLQEKFLAMLPLIQHQAYVAFRGLPSEERDDMVAEVVANSFCALARLMSRGKEDHAYATPLAQFAIRQIRQGRRVGTRLNRSDVMSGHAQRADGLIVERLDHYQQGAWKEALVEDRKAGPAEIAAARIDVGAWLQSLSHRNRRIAETLASGERASDVADRFRLSRGRLSQLRALLAASWENFH